MTTKEQRARDIVESVVVLVGCLAIAGAAWGVDWRLGLALLGGGLIVGVALPRRRRKSE